jgi:hypothetical protein
VTSAGVAHTLAPRRRDGISAGSNLPIGPSSQRGCPSVPRALAGYLERKIGCQRPPRMGACRDDTARASRDAQHAMSEREPKRYPDVAGEQRPSEDRFASPLRLRGSALTRLAAGTRRRSAVPRPSRRPDAKAFVVPRRDVSDRGSPPPDGRSAIELDGVRIKQERTASSRSGASRVVELPRHGTENGWSYERAA